MTLRVGATSVELTATQAVITADTVLCGSASAIELVGIQRNMDLLAAAFDAWTPSGGDGGGALKIILTALDNAGWPFSVSKTKVE